MAAIPRAHLPDDRSGGTDGVDASIAALRAEVAELRAEVAELRDRTLATEVASDEPAP